MKRKVRKFSKIVVFVPIVLLCACGKVTSVFTYNYDFSSGTSPSAVFGESIRYDEPAVTSPTASNERRNKDAAYNPPPYFYGSGNIPTDLSSLYHDNTQSGGKSGNFGDITGNTNASTTSYGNIDVSAISSSNANSSAINDGISLAELPQTTGFQSATSALITTPAYFDDGSIGTLYIERTGKTIKVYEGEDLSNLKKGAGHFVSTSAWDGNAAFCGHNRGSWPFFEFVKNMQMGDKVTYTTPYGSRVYAVFSKEQIEEHDYSKLGWTAENTLTFITCVENVSENRWAVQLREEA